MSTTKPTPVVELATFVKQTIDKEIELAIEEEFKELEKRVSHRKSQIVSTAVLHIQKMMQVETKVDNLIITVKLDK